MSSLFLPKKAKTPRSSKSRSKAPEVILPPPLELTKVEVYDLAAARWGSEAAALELGDRCVVGRWRPMAETARHSHGEAGLGGVVLKTARANAVEVAGEGASWTEAARAAGLV